MLRVNIKVEVLVDPHCASWRVLLCWGGTVCGLRREKQPVKGAGIADVGGAVRQLGRLETISLGAEQRQA